MGKASRQQAAVRPLLYALAASLVGGLVYGIAVSLNRQNAKPVGAPGAVAGPVTARVPVRALGKALDPEVAQYGLPDGTSFLPEYKNPCWRVAGDAALRCLPYVYIIGSFQAGSNTLFAKLSQHPDIVTNDVSRWQFWAEDGKSMSEYVGEHSSGQSLKELQSSPATKIILDGSGSTFAFYWSANLRAHRAFQSVMVPCWRECSEGSKGNRTALLACTQAKCFTRAMEADIEVAKRTNVSYDALQLPVVLAFAYGETYRPKLIVLLRHPVDRVHCAYWQYPHYHNKYGKTAEGFLAYVKEQVGALKKCAQRFTGQIGGRGVPMDPLSAERHCALYFEALGNEEEQVFFHADQLMRGMYSLYIDIWLRHFPRDTLLVIPADKTYFVDQQKTLDQVASFLNLTAATPEQKDKMLRAGKASPCTRNAPSILPEASQILMHLYRPYNEHLASLLNDSSWLDYNTPPKSTQTAQATQ